MSHVISVSTIEFGHFVNEDYVFVASDFWDVVAPEEALLVEPSCGEVDLMAKFLQEDVLPESVASNNGGD